MHTIWIKAYLHYDILNRILQPDVFRIVIVINGHELS